MNAQITTARGILRGRRGIAGCLGKGPVICVAIVAFLVAALLGGHALTQPSTASHDASATNPSTPSASVSAAQYYDDLMSQQEDWIHTMAARATMRRAAAYYDDLMAQQDDFLHTMAARADALRVDTAAGCDDEMRCLSMYAPAPAANDTVGGAGCGDEMVCPWAYGPDAGARMVEPRVANRVSDILYYVPTAGGMGLVLRVDPDGGLSTVGYVSGPPSANGIPVASSAQRQCTHVPVGFPTCYALQDDGTWAREELADADSDWVIVGTVTYEEMTAAVGETRASAR